MYFVCIPLRFLLLLSYLWQVFVLEDIAFSPTITLPFTWFSYLYLLTAWHLPLNHQKDDKCVQYKIKLKTLLGELYYFGHIMSMEFLERDNIGKVEGSRKKLKPRMRWIDFMKEGLVMSPQELNRAIEHRPLWTSLIHTDTRSLSQFNDK